MLPQDLRYIAERVYDLPDLGGFSAVEREVVLEAYMRAVRYVFAMQAPMIGGCLGLQLLVKDRGLATRE